MQTSTRQFILIAFAALLFFTSCSKSNKQGRYIPEGAAMVLHVDGKSLSAKLPWEEIRQSEVFKQAYTDSSTTAFVKTILDNPANTGIDVKNDILFFVVKDSTGGFMAIEGTVGDEARFRQFNKEASKNTGVESTNDGINFMVSDDMTASWDKDKFVVVMDAPMFNKMNAPKNLYDDSSEVIKPVVKRNMIPVAKEIFNLKENQSLGKDEKFTALMKSGGDIHFWINSESLAKETTGAGFSMGPLSMINLNKLYEGSRIAGTVSFENGRLLADVRSYSGKEMTELMNKYSGDKVNTDMLKRIPSKNLAALLALNFKPEGIREYLKLLGLEGFANMGAPMLGLSVDDFIKANKGDILLAVSDINTDSAGKPDVSILFSASIGDKPSFDKLINAGKKFLSEKGGENSTSIFHNMNEKYFAIGNKKQQVDTYTTTVAGQTFDFMDKIGSSAGVVYINFQYFLKAMGPGMRKDTFELQMYDASVKTWDNMLAYGKGNQTQHFEINFIDKSTNSLKLLNNYLGTLGMIKKKQDEQYKNSVKADELEADSVSIGTD